MVKVDLWSLLYLCHNGTVVDVLKRHSRQLAALSIPRMTIRFKFRVEMRGHRCLHVFSHPLHVS